METTYTSVANEISYMDHGRTLTGRSSMASTHVDTVDVATLVRKHLKRQFPGVKFSVRSKRYSGGSSIDVDWTDGPTSKQVQSVCDLYKGASFDGMIDLKSYHDTWMRDEHGDAQLVHMGADYVFAQRRISSEWETAIFALFSRVIGRDVTGYNDLVPLKVDWSTGELYHMVESETEYLSTVFHQFTGYRQGGNVGITV
jgi:hypothetical protein